MKSSSVVSFLRKVTSMGEVQQPQYGSDRACRRLRLTQGEPHAGRARPRPCDRVPSARQQAAPAWCASSSKAMPFMPPATVGIGATR